MSNMIIRDPLHVIEEPLILVVRVIAIDSILDQDQIKREFVCEKDYLSDL